jgi:hypothetical protein
MFLAELLIEGPWGILVLLLVLLQLCRRSVVSAAALVAAAPVAATICNCCSLPTCKQYFVFADEKRALSQKGMYSQKAML